MGHPLLNEDNAQIEIAKIFKKGSRDVKPFFFGETQQQQSEQELTQASVDIPEAVIASQDKDEAFVQGWFKQAHVDIHKGLSEAEQNHTSSFDEKDDIQEEASFKEYLAESEQVFSISEEEYERALEDARQQAYAQGERDGEKSAQRSQSQGLIQELQHIVHDIETKQDAAHEGFKAISEELTAALSGVVAKLVPSLRERGYQEYITQAIEDVFVNAMPDLKVTMIIHQDDKDLIERALMAVPQKEVQRLTIADSGAKKGQIELRWPDSSIQIDWDKVSAKLLEKIQSLTGDNHHNKMRDEGRDVTKKQDVTENLSALERIRKLQHNLEKHVEKARHS